MNRIEVSMGMLDWFRSRRHSGTDDTSKDIDPELLPHWARVAYAARCARYTQAMMRERLSDVSSRIQDAIENAILLAEQSARQAQTASNAEETVKRLLVLPTEAEADRQLTQACAAAAQSVIGGGSASRTWCHHSWQYARDFAAIVGDRSLDAKLRDDFLQLVEYCQKHQVTDDQAVDAEQIFRSV
jgi:hypothetical protein